MKPMNVARTYGAKVASLPLLWLLALRPSLLIPLTHWPLLVVSLARLPPTALRCLASLLPSSAS